MQVKGEEKKCIVKLFRENKKIKGVYQLYTSGHKFRSKVKGKLSAHRELKSLAVQGKKLLIWDILITTTNGDRKIMEPIKMTNGTAARLRKLNQFYQFR